MIRRKITAILLLSVSRIIAVCGYAHTSMALEPEGNVAPSSISGDVPEISFLYRDKDEVEQGASQNIATVFPRKCRFNRLA